MSWKQKVSIKLMAILYLSFLTTSYLVSSTNAYFNDYEQTIGSIKAGTWEVISSQWDKSSLVFTSSTEDKPDNQEIVIELCTSGNISATIKNGGSDMEGPSEYEVYYTKKGNPKKGIKIASGTIPPITSEQKTTLTQEISDPGHYKFRALQRPGHGNKENTRHDLWSSTITVICKDSDKTAHPLQSYEAEAQNDQSVESENQLEENQNFYTSEPEQKSEMTNEESNNNAETTTATTNDQQNPSIISEKQETRASNEELNHPEQTPTLEGE
ncbi:amyloid fiber anchoring/assembly protein TapA [Bacillus spongiae]|uniref:Amyloid fiber anchoring/assembly protein TapA n=1 Tax=Bacillus spongiae TaxID=2683610 RepID=A0ABU8HEG2_9BACI